MVMTDNERKKKIADFLEGAQKEKAKTDDTEFIDPWTPEEITAVAEKILERMGIHGEEIVRMWRKS